MSFSLQAKLRYDRDIRIIAEEDFNQFYLRNSKLFPVLPRLTRQLTKSKSSEEHHALLLAARKKFDCKIVHH